LPTGIYQRFFFMLTDQPADIALTDLLDALPDAVLWMRTVRNEAHQVVNFRIEYANQKAQAITKGVYTLTPGTMVLDNNGHDRATSEKNFQDMCAVLETNQPQEFSYFNDQLNVWFQVNRARLGDGILSVTRNITALKTAEQTGLDESRRAQQRVEQVAAHLQHVIDNSQTGIFVFSPVYDPVGQLVDFRFKTINRMVAALVGQTPELLTGAIASDWFISYRETGLFDRYKQTHETGEEQRFEIHYNVDGFNVWFDVKAIKLGTDVLVTFTDFTSLKQAQQAIERQAGLLNSVLNGSINGIMAFEAIRDEGGVIQDFVFLSSNEAACRMVGKSADELVGTRLLTVFPGNKETGLFDKYVQTVETGMSTRTETYYKHDGLDVWLDISAQKIDDGFVVTFTDISIVKRASVTVEQSADELRTVIDSAQVAIFRIHPVRNDAGKIIDFRFRTANQMIARYVNQEPDALTGELVGHWFPGYLTNGLLSRYAAVFETNRTQHFNFHYVTPAVDFWINVSVIKLGNDVLVTFSDFTEIKKLQQRLEASTAELQTVIDTSQTGIFLFSPVRNQAGEVIDFRFRLANRQLASYVGQEPEVVVGALGSTWFPDYKTNGLFDRYYKTYATGESQRFDFHYDGSGIDVWLDIMATKMGDDVLVTFGDYTPLKLLQQQLHNSVIDLQRSNKNLEQFAYVASHDLQEPLRKIQAFGDIIQAQYAPVLGESGADMISRMQSAAARMQVLIKDVLAYSRITTKPESLRSVSLADVVRDVLTDMETTISDKQATVTVEPMPAVRGDAAQLRQLFQNLISNALKFTKTDKAAARPAIRITTRRVAGRELPEFGLSPAIAERPFHLIEVADNGIGFDPHQAERIFQVFQRLHGRSEYQGTGIGLAIVQKVVENHQGYIIAEGRPGQGATFRMLLPV
jgi:PAS domain S-box-containing protein